MIQAARLPNLVELGSLTAPAAAFLEASMCAGLNILVAGGTQAGNLKVVNTPSKAQYHLRMTAVPEGEDLEVELVLQEALEELRRVARAAGLTAEPSLGFDDETVLLRIEYPEARGFRAVEYDVEDVKPLAGVELANVRFLPDTLGYVDTATGRIEVQVRVRNMFLLQRISGYESLDVVDEPTDEDDELIHVRIDSRWRLSVERDGVTIELSPMSEEFRAIRSIATSRRPRLTTIKISGAASKTTEETIESFRTLSDAFFFDLDVRYGIVAEEMSVPRRAPGVRPRRVSLPASFPENRYLAQPVSLYRYGRSAQGLPLLSFLAFYQVLEFFFPIFSQEDVTRRVQQTLRNPRFEPPRRVRRLSSLRLRRLSGSGGERSEFALLRLV